VILIWSYIFAMVEKVTVHVGMRLTINCLAAQKQNAQLNSDVKQAG
jgi:hypothetical protein